ncbi:MAG: hypothetical protein IPI00_14405 [Flavobacteriales bacterium]|nr:hypothetical protein [Flavobacteriales bacterium]MBK7241322.1 hypothetical protein [Flavobacteriales bacterium]MBP9140002.1 hypothetical protein [Flavobacteriales bacterium]HQX30463.1 hypothetical protein [Flavobacteriales bacterium]HQX38846.1 hypothetical protein [Flavobacteriales bacterium]
MMLLPRIAMYFASVLVLISCTADVRETVNDQEVDGGWELQRFATKRMDSIEFVFPMPGYAYDHRDSLVDACMNAIERNKQLLGLDEFKAPYKIKFYPSKAAMKEDINIGVSGHADHWNKEVAFVATNDPETIEKENIIPAPIVHETMHMIAMEEWGFPPENNLWLNEGLATYAANNCNGESVDKVYRYLMGADMLVPMDSLVSQFYKNDEMVAYHQAAHIVEHLLELGGVEKMATLWREGFTSLERVYGVPFSEVESTIKSKLEKKYPNGVELDWETFKKGCK